MIAKFCSCLSEIAVKVTDLFFFVYSLLRYRRVFFRNGKMRARDPLVARHQKQCDYFKRSGLEDHTHGD